MFAVRFVCGDEQRMTGWRPCSGGQVLWHGHEQFPMVPRGSMLDIQLHRQLPCDHEQRPDTTTATGSAHDGDETHVGSSIFGEASVPVGVRVAGLDSQMESWVQLETPSVRRSDPQLTGSDVAGEIRILWKFEPAETLLINNANPAHSLGALVDRAAETVRRIAASFFLFPNGTFSSLSARATVQIVTSWSSQMHSRLTYAFLQLYSQLVSTVDDERPLPYHAVERSCTEKHDNVRLAEKTDKHNDDTITLPGQPNSDGAQLIVGPPSLNVDVESGSDIRVVEPSHAPHASRERGAQHGRTNSLDFATSQRGNGSKTRRTNRASIATSAMVHNSSKRRSREVQRGTKKQEGWARAHEAVKETPAVRRARAIREYREMIAKATQSQKEANNQP